MATACGQCGTAAAAGATFCGSCGAALGTMSSEASPRASTVTPPPPRRQASRSRWVVFGASGLVVVVVLAATGYQRWQSVRTESAAAASTAQGTPRAEPGAPPETESLTQLAEEAETLTRNQAELTRAMQAAVARYQARSGGALPAGIGAELTPEQRALLTERLKSERMGTASLLKDLLAKDLQLQELKKRIAELNERLPDSVIAGEGQRHERIAMDYLSGKGLQTEEAYRLVSQAALTEPLIPGFRVFLLFQNGQFGTWVTQGAANTSPKVVQEQLAKLASAERDAAVQALEATKADRDDLRKMASAADKSREDTQTDLRAMQAVSEREHALNSTLRYVVGSKSELVKNQVIDRSYRLLPARSDGSTFMPAGPAPLPPIDPSAYGLKRVRRVTLVPGLVAEGQDYTVSNTDGFLSVSIVRPERFSQYAKFFVIVLE